MLPFAATFSLALYYSAEADGESQEALSPVIIFAGQRTIRVGSIA